MRAVERMHNEDDAWVTGWRAGKTPLQLLEEAASAGPLPVARLGDEEIGFVFSRRDTAIVQAGGAVNCFGYRLHATVLASQRWMGREVEVRWPLVGNANTDPNRLAVHVVDPATGKRICIARRGRALGDCADHARWHGARKPGRRTARRAAASPAGTGAPEEGGAAGRAAFTDQHQHRRT